MVDPQAGDVQTTDVGRQAVLVDGVCIICQRSPETCPGVTHGCLAVGLLAEMRAEDSSGESRSRWLTKGHHPLQPVSATTGGDQP